MNTLRTKYWCSVCEWTNQIQWRNSLIDRTVHCVPDKLLQSLHRHFRLTRPVKTIPVVPFINCSEPNVSVGFHVRCVKVRRSSAFNPYWMRIQRTTDNTKIMINLILNAEIVRCMERFQTCNDVSAAIKWLSAGDWLDVACVVLLVSTDAYMSHT